MTVRRRLILLGLILFAIYCVMAAMGPPEILDVYFYYSPSEAAAFFARLNEAQSHTYLIHEIVDLLFLATYTAIYFYALDALSPKHRYLAFVPGFFDVLENSGIFAVLLGVRPALVFPWLGIATCIKWSLGTCLTLFVLFAFKRRKLFE